MKKLFLFPIIVLIFSGSGELRGQQHYEDSLVVVLQTKSDSARIPVLLSLCWELRNTAPDRSIKFGMEAIDLTSRYHDYENLAKAYSFVGVANRVMGKYSQCIDFYYKGLEIAEKHGINEQAGYAHLNLANLYIYQQHPDLAFVNIKESEAIARTTGNKKMLAYAFIYYGRTYKLKGDLDSALVCYKQSLLIRQELNQVPEQATCYKYTGDIYFEKGEYTKAFENYNLSLEKVDRENDKDLYANILIKKALLLLNENRLTEASVLAHESLNIAGNIGADITTRDALQVLVTISQKTHDYRSASEYQQRVISYNKALFSQELSEKIFFMEYQLEKQKKEIKIDLLNKENNIKQLEIKRIRAISIALTLALVLLVSVFIALLHSLKQRRNKTILLELQNQEIIGQRNSIEQQNRSLVDANLKLEKSQDDLRRMMQTKDKLFSIIAHDLRNPFTALSGLTEILQRNASTIEPSEVAEYASMINESSHKLLILIENLLQWANSQTGRLKLIPKAINLGALADETLRVLYTQAEAKGIVLKNEIPDQISVYADSETLAIIIRNLVSNGIKYTNRGGVVALSANEVEGRTVLKVSDTGVGMSIEALGKLFRIEESFTTEGTCQEVGSGLGLVICKEFVEKNGGTITVESRVGEGTVFYISLPSSKM